MANKKLIINPLHEDEFQYIINDKTFVKTILSTDWIDNGNGTSSYTILQTEHLEQTKPLIKTLQGDTPTGVAFKIAPNGDVVFTVNTDAVFNCTFEITGFDVRDVTVATPPLPTFNFEMDALLAQENISDITTFILWLNSVGVNNVVVNDLVITGNNLKANISGDSVGIRLTNVAGGNENVVYRIKDLSGINFNVNSFLSFNNSSTLEFDIKGISNNVDWIYINSEQLTDFNPTELLPTNLRVIGINTASISELNYDFSYLTNLVDLYFDSFQFVNFYFLADGVTKVELYPQPLPLLFNQIGPNFNTPPNISILSFQNCPFTNATFTQLEPWANGLPVFVTPTNFNFIGTIDTIVGTPLHAILLSKNINILT
jgi:hypothetical protein